MLTCPLARFFTSTARLIQQLKSKEAASLQLMQDTAKGSQRERMLKVLDSVSRSLSCKSLEV